MVGSVRTEVINFFKEIVMDKFIKIAGNDFNLTDFFREMFSIYMNGNSPIEKTKINLLANCCSDETVKEYKIFEI